MRLLTITPTIRAVILCVKALPTLIDDHLHLSDRGAGSAARAAITMTPLRTEASITQAHTNPVRQISLLSDPELVFSGQPEATKTPIFHLTTAMISLKSTSGRPSTIALLNSSNRLAARFRMPCSLGWVPRHHPTSPWGKTPMNERSLKKNEQWLGLLVPRAPALVLAA